MNPLAILMGSALALAATCDAAVQPNIVFIMADDLGWSDLGCYGSRYHRTPNLDRLAARGVKFTQAYAANPLCSPTRSSVLTGLWPARTGLTAPVCHLPQVVLEKGLAKGSPKRPVLVAESVTRLQTDYVTLPKVLRAAGYRTGHFGKWHLGPEPYSPLQHGFDVDWPRWPGPGPGGAYVAPWAPKFPEKGKPGEHIEDTLSSKVAAYIRENKDRPFFVNYWPFSVHAPYDAKPELVAKYRELADPGNPQRNPVYGAMVESLDDGVGRVMAALEENGLLDKTIIVFFSDNGGVSWTVGDAEGPKRKADARFPTDMESPPTSNLPLRSGKASLYEGGVRVPCIVTWPGVTKPGMVNDTIIQSIDWMPTLLEMAGVPLPATAKPDGRSFVSALNGGAFDRDTIFCHFPHDTPASGQHPGTSVRRGDWKLIRLFAQNDDGSDQFELYDLKTDLGETKNLATEKPDLVRELNALLDGFLKDTAAVIPKRNPDFNPAAAAPKAKAQRGAPVSPKRPNVLFILTEDQGAQMAALGTPDIATPRMDALAASGTLFRRAYVGYPVCSASKACIYTGLYPHSNGLLNNTKNHFKPAAELTAEDRANGAYTNVQIRTRNPTLVQMLKRSGYHCGVTGKLHVAPNERFPYDEFIHVREKTPLSRLAANAREKGKPWFLFYNTIGSPHRPFVDSEKQPIGLDPAKVTLPGHLPDTPTARRDWAEYLHGVQLADAALGRILDELAASGAEQDTLVVFMGDHGPAYPRGKLTPYHLGLHVPLIVRLPGVKGGHTTDALVHQIDLMPTLLDALSIAYTDWKMQGRSLRPLIEGKADATGHDFIFSEVGGNDLRQRPTTEERSVISTRYHFIARSGIQHGRIIGADSRDWAVWRNRIYDEIIRVKDTHPEPYRILAEMDPAKLHGQPPALEFYDLQTDPHELINLAPDPAHRAELERHHTALAQWCRETQDKAFILPPLSAVTPASASGKAKGQAGTPTKHFAPAPSSAPDPHTP